MFEFLETQKENMIQTALKCFTSANKVTVINLFAVVSGCLFIFNHSLSG